MSSGTAEVILQAGPETSPKPWRVMENGAHSFSIGTLVCAQFYTCAQFYVLNNPSLCNTSVLQGSYRLGALLVAGATVNDQGTSS